MREKKREKYDFKYKLYLSSIFLYTQVSNGCQFQEDKTDNVHCNILKESDEYLKDKSTVVEDLKEYAMSDNTMLIKDSTFLDTLQIDKNEDKDKSQDYVL